MSLISDTYFIRDIALPASKYSTLQEFLNRYENSIIQDLFGYELGTLVIAYDAGTSAQRIKDIVEGKEYTNSEGVLMKWKGLANSDKVSLIAYWVYYWWSRENESYLSGSGSSKSKKKNAINDGFAVKASYAWHEMLKLYGYVGQPVIEPSCFNFMLTFESTYPEWVFTEKSPINRFGI